MGRFNFNLTPNTLQKQTKTFSKLIIMTWDNVFKHFDADNSGSIDLNEFKAILAKLGNSDAAKAEEHFKKADADGSGAIDAKEFAALAEAACEKAFKVIDADNSGNVSPAEISAAVKGVDASAFLAVADKDGDGEISLSEFKAALATDAKFLPLVFAAM